MAQLYALADNLELNVTDTAAFVADLNDAGAAPMPAQKLCCCSGAGAHWL